MNPYIGLVHQTADSAFGITFPDAPGCFSAVDRLDELFAAADEAIGLWTEAMLEVQADIPATRGLSDIRLDPAWTDAFSEAALVIAISFPGRPMRAAA